MLDVWPHRALAIFVAVGGSLGALPVTAQDDAALRHAREILRQAPLVDTHNDTPWLIREDKSSSGSVALYDLRKPCRTRPT